DGAGQPPAGLTGQQQPSSENRKENRMGATRPVTDETFEAEVLQSTRPVLVDYWAGRCGLSKMIAPILEAIAEEHGDKLGIVKLNVDENPQVTQKYNILNIPTWRRIRRFRLTGA